MPSSALRRSAAALAAGALACGFAVAVATPASAVSTVHPVSVSADDAALSLSPIGTFSTGVFDASAAEIVAAHGDRLFVVNAQQASVSVLDVSTPSDITELYTIAGDGVANSVAVRGDGLGVIALEAADKVSPGRLMFFDATADAPRVLGTVEVGSLPDMVAISADGTYAVVADEGEPADDFSVDPEGSIGVVSLPDHVAAPTQSDVRIADFHAFENGALPDGVRVFGPTPHGDDLPVSRNLEPEYVTIEGTTAYATLQEANAIATIDLASARVTDIRPLGYADHGAADHALDPSDKDGRFEQRTFPGLHGVYMPDAISSYTAAGESYLVTANEGDAREWGSYAEPSRVASLAKNGRGPVCADSPLAAHLADDELGRLNVTTELGFDEDAGCYAKLYAFGSRSFSIWSTDGTQVFDSGGDIERITAEALPDFANANHTDSAFEGRSDDKGPEPEGVSVGQVGDRTYAFVGLERIGGVIVYDITDPVNATFETYINNRDLAVSMADAEDPAAALAAAGDLGAEGVTFLPAATSPTGSPALAVANEVSGTTTLFAIESATDEDTVDVQVLTINDFHGRLEPNFANGEAGAAVLAGAVDALRAENPHTLFVSAGDNIGASTFTSFVQRDEPTIDALTAAGLDASAVGNHEFDRGFADLTDRVLPRYGDAAFGLGANVYERAGGKPALQEYTVREVDGVRVAFIATVTADTATMVAPTGIADIMFGDQLEAANRVAAQITRDDAADAIVLLTHDGAAGDDCAALEREDTTYAHLVREAAPEIDAIVSGHTHQAYSCEIAGRPVVQAHQYGTTLGDVDITVDRQTKAVTGVTARTIPLVVDGQPAFEPNAEVAAIVDSAVGVAEQEGSQQVGRISADILRGGEAGSDRGVESSLGNLVADIELWATSGDAYAGTPAAIAFMNPGGLRADLLFGDDGAVSKRQVADVQPFANNLVTMTLTGAQIRQVLEQQWQPDGSSRPRLHLGVSDGFSYTYDPNAARGEHITSMTLHGSEVGDGDTYTIVTNSFLAGGGDNFTAFASGSDVTDTGQVDLAATLAYFAAHDVVDPAPLGRAVASGAEPVEPDAWASVDVGSGSVAQGETLSVTVSGLETGRQIAATLHSEPLVATAIPAADADGTVRFTIAIPADFATGAHSLVVEADGEQPIATPVTVTETVTDDGATPSTPGSTAPGSTTPGAALPVTGAELPLGLALLGAMALVAGAVIIVLRRRVL